LSPIKLKGKDNIFIKLDYFDVYITIFKPTWMIDTIKQQNLNLFWFEAQAVFLRWNVL
jgi:hypothetical protein